MSGTQRICCGAIVPRIGSGLALAVALSTAGASSFDMGPVSAGEMARLPEYCPHTLAYGGPDFALWRARLGETFTHLHHYCWGLLKANRAVAPGVRPQHRRALFASAVQECYYVLDRAPADFVLRPEILLKAGVFYGETGDVVRALEHYEQSRAAKPDYWPPYVEAVDLNMKLGRKQHAIDWLKEGLRVMPQEPRLLEALARIERAPAGPSAKNGGSGR